MDNFYTLSPKGMWSQFRREPFAFWMICLYLILQYVEPQSIIPSLAVLPWDKVVAGLAILGLFADPERRWVRDTTNIWMTLFFLVILLSSALAEYPSISWKHWYDFFNWYVSYFLIINVVTTMERYYIFLGIYLLASFKMSLFGARVWASRDFGFRNWGIQGPPGFFANSGEFSIQMLMFAPIAYELALFLKPRVQAVKYWSVMLLPITAVMTVIGASSRGSQLALAFQSGLIAIRRKLSLKGLIAAAAILWVGYAMLPAQEKARFSVVGNDPTSVQRLDYWRAGLDMIKNHPLLGVGFFNFPQYYLVHYPHELWHGTAQLPHNIFIQVGTDAGLLGLTIFLILIYRNIKIARNIERECVANKAGSTFAPAVARGLVVAAWGFVVAGQFVTVTYYPFFWINLALTVALKNVVTRRTGQAAQAPSVRVPGAGKRDTECLDPRQAFRG